MKAIFTTDRPFTDSALTILRGAMRTITPEPVEFVPVDHAGPDVLGFGVEGCKVTTLDPYSIPQVARADRILVRDLRRYFDMEPEPRLCPGDNPDKTLYFDIESHSASEIWDLSPRQFFRLGQYAWGPHGKVHHTTDYDEMISLIRAADMVVGHNIHAFDLTALFGKDSTEPLEMARDSKVFDTFVYAILAFPAPWRFQDRKGHLNYVDGPGKIQQWLSLDNLSYQLDLEGKIGDLKAMAKKYGGFCHIPLDDPEFLAYADQDIVALQELTHELLSMKPIDDYDWREQKFAGVCAQNSRNGFKVDVAKAEARRDQLAQRKQELMDRLVVEYGFPTTGKQPWRSTVGKEAIFKILSDAGITPHSVPEWKKTATGNLSLGGEVLLEITKGTPVQELGESLAELMGQRSLSQLALDSMKSDGFTHPDVTALQRSGRVSTTRPAFTIWSARGGKSIEKSYFVPDSDEELLVELDFSQADARIVAAYSGDTEFAKRFEEGSDAHMITAYAVWGDEVDNNPKYYRELAKACIAEGEPVLTDHGLVPIEQVTKDQKVWDGLNWVEHDGVIFQGYREVLTYDGLTATRDHKVFVRGDDGTLKRTDFETAVERNIPIIRSGDSTQELRVGSGYVRGPSVKGEKQEQGIRLVSLGQVHGLPGELMGEQRKLDFGAEPRVLTMFQRKTDPLSEVVTYSFDRCEAEVREPEQTRVSELRSSGGQVQVREYKRSSDVHLQQLPTSGQITGDRPNQHKWSLRTGKLEASHSEREPRESPNNGSQRVRSTILALSGRTDSEIAGSGSLSGASDRECQGNSSQEVQELQTNIQKVRVYDIVNAGPHSRFTVSDKLVSNCGHAYAYRSGPKTIAKTAKQPLEIATRFVNEMNAAYPKVIEWQERVTRLGESGTVTNDWGRKMLIETDRSYTQSPAMFGQSGTRELMVDALLRMLDTDVKLITMLKAQVHDALVFSVPKQGLPEYVETIRSLMETEWQPSDGSGQLIQFPVSAGRPETDWEKAGH